MIFHSVKLMNYKSIGEENCELIIEPNVTSIIGKNESGKSNIISGLSNFNFFNAMQPVFTANNTNRNNSNLTEMKFIVNLKFTLAEKEEFGVTADTQFIRTKDNDVAIGGIFDVYNTLIRPEIDNLFAKLSTNPFNLNGTDYTNYQKHVRSIMPESVLDFTALYGALVYLARMFPIIKTDEKENILAMFNEVDFLWKKLLESIPKIFFYDSNRILKQQYTFDEVQKELNPNTPPTDSLLASFVDILGVERSDFVTAANHGTQPTQTNLRRKIQRKINENFNSSFNEFYNTEKLTLDCQFNAGVISFNIQSSDGEVMHLNERSNGLRWYLNMFIDTFSNNLPSKNVLYLFDEPATSLHINAQKEILKLFNDLASKGNQIIYTTHSPFMLTTDDGGLHRIRAVDKTNDGYTHIYKTAYDARIAPENQTDIFAPIIKAIGMDLSSTFGPARDKINIVCEGVSDYIYFKTTAKIIGVSDDYNFIPSTGVTNVPNMCNLLLGWNCPFIAVFDYDNEGVEKGGNVMKKNELYKENEDFIYIKNELTKLDFENKTYNVTPYMVEDIIGRDELVEFAIKNGLGENALKDNKTILAKFYCTALERGEQKLSETCKKEFAHLFSKIETIIKDKK